jgi:hypothetical protein
MFTDIGLILLSWVVLAFLVAVPVVRWISRLDEDGEPR